jgi:Undecaprenyl-phosphate galactose phosphotransferase WbaP
MSVTERVGPLRRGLGFAFGVGFAAVPAVGPFVALLAIALGRLELHRADRLWWIVAGLLGLPWMLTGSVAAGLGASGQILAVWLVHRSASAARQAVGESLLPRDVGAGLVVGLALTLAVGLRHLAPLQVDAALTVLDALSWHGHSALFGHAVLVVASLLAIILPTPRLRAAALVLGGLGVLLSGAREAQLVFLGIAVALLFVRREGWRRATRSEWGIIIVVAIISSGVAAHLGLGRPGFVTDIARLAAGGNLLRGTEVAVGDWWHALGVSARGGEGVVDGVHRAVHHVTKDWPEPWSRLQQVVVLQPGTTYTLSAALRPESGGRPGLDGWGQPREGGPAAIVSSTLAGETLRAHASGPIEVLSTGTLPLADGWTRTAVTFRFLGAAPLAWYTGAVVDRSERVGVTLEFAELQMSAGDALLPYVPGAATRGATLEASRFPVWSDAAAAISARPLRGWGVEGLPRAMIELRPEEVRARPVAAHAHNALLAAWVERGLLGALGLVGLFGLLALRAVQQRDQAALVVLAGVATLNLFDATLLAGSVLYPLAAVLGWRAVQGGRTAIAESGVTSATAVRLGLAATDLAVAAACVAGAVLVIQRFDPGVDLVTAWSGPLAYALLVWPAMAWGTGLYPAYGVSSHDALARSVRAAAAAGLLVGFATYLFPAALPLPKAAVVVAGLATVFMAPLARRAAIHLLRALRLWGRPVVLIGTGPAAAAVARHLHIDPSIGLRPVAAFGDEAAWDVHDIPLRGHVDDVWEFIAREGVRHAIITPDASHHLGYDEVLLRASRHLRYVQFLPEIPGLPAISFAAAPLGTSLALETRIELASSLNRVVKRLLDVVGALTLTIALTPLLLVVAAWIRIDSRGPVLYLSQRVGRSGRPFRCIKFRTMSLDAERDLEHLMARLPDVREEYQRFHKLRDDPRVTRAGRTLRRFSIDELPQLVNVLIGDMSLVGPRPYLVREIELMGSERDLVFLARPGMTGYWQVAGRNDVNFAERQAMEAHYVRNWSVWWDIDLLLRTPVALLRRRGA